MKHTFLLFFFLILRPALACFPPELDFTLDSDANEKTHNDSDSPTRSDRPNLLNQEYFFGYYAHTKYIISSPARWSVYDWTGIAAGFGVLCVIYNNDQTITDWMTEHKSDDTKRLADVAEKFGNGYYPLPALAVFYGYGYIFHDNRAQRAGLLSVESAVISEMFTGAIKITAGRHRPSTGDPHDSWHGPFTLDNSFNSFPSGHSTFVWSWATVFAMEYEDTVIVPIVAYSIATLTALSRVHDRAHWASDVFAGSAIGYFTARAVYTQARKNQHWNWSVSPAITPDGAGIEMASLF
jgi:hypothetical protein